MPWPPKPPCPPKPMPAWAEVVVAMVVAVSAPTARVAATRADLMLRTRMIALLDQRGPVIRARCSLVAEAAKEVHAGLAKKRGPAGCGSRVARSAPVATWP